MTTDGTPAEEVQMNKYNYETSALRQNAISKVQQKMLGELAEECV